MSKEAASEFIEKAQTDDAIRQKLVGLGTGAQIEDVLDVAATSGYRFNESELMAAGKDAAEKSGKQPEGELSERELEMVAGGRFNLTHTRWFITTDTATVIVKK